nr:unnamed protein product [Callosobruchus analis]
MRATTSSNSKNPKGYASKAGGNKRREGGRPITMAARHRASRQHTPEATSRERNTEAASTTTRSKREPSSIREKFKAHSTRHAATSAALIVGSSIESIRNAAGWTQK